MSASIRSTFEDRGHGHGLLRLLVDEQHRPDAAVRVAAALERAPLRLEAAEQVLQIRERPRRRQRVPVAHRLADAGLRLHVVREVRERVALARARLVVDVLVAAGEGDRLERDGVDLVDVLDRELQDVADLVVVDAVDDRHDERDVDAVLLQVLDRAQLDVVEVADLAVLVVLVADAVELQVGEAQARLGRLLREVLVLREADAVGRALDGEVAELAGVADRRQEVRRERRLAARELDRQLAARLDRGRVVEQLLDLFPLELVDVADLVGVHEARVAHHVAAVGQVDREHRAAAVLDRRRAVLVEAVLRNHEVAAGYSDSSRLKKAGIRGHHVLEVPVLRAVLLHQDLAVLLDDLGRDLAGLALDQDLPVGFAREDLRADLRDAARAERVGLARKAERRKASSRAA